MLIELLCLAPFLLTLSTARMTPLDFLYTCKTLTQLQVVARDVRGKDCVNDQHLPSCPNDLTGSPLPTIRLPPRVGSKPTMPCLNN